MDLVRLATNSIMVVASELIELPVLLHQLSNVARLGLLMVTTVLELNWLIVTGDCRIPLYIVRLAAKISWQ